MIAPVGGFFGRNENYNESFVGVASFSLLEPRSKLLVEIALWLAIFLIGLTPWYFLPLGVAMCCAVVGLHPVGTTIAVGVTYLLLGIRAVRTPRSGESDDDASTKSTLNDVYSVTRTYVVTFVAGSVLMAPFLDWWFAGWYFDSAMLLLFVQLLWGCSLLILAAAFLTWRYPNAAGLYETQQLADGDHFIVGSIEVDEIA